jgi:FkbM family methyltransferase
MSLQLAPYAAYKALIGRREAFFEVREDDFKEDVDKSVIPNAFGKHWNQDTWHAIQIAQISNKTQETGFWIRVADSLVRMVCHRSFYPFFTQVLHGEYFIPRLPLRNMRVVDIGANTGAYTVFMLRDYGLTWTYDSITCYEPNPDNFACLKHNVEAVGKAIELPKIELVRKAVSSITDAKLRLPKGGNFGSWSLYGSEESSETTIEVETIHPSAIPDCDMLKIDAEMAEIDILTHFLKRPSLPIFVFLEYHSMELFLQQFNLMGELFLPYRISQKAIS